MISTILVPEQVNQLLIDSASLLETVHTGIDSRNLQRRGEFETELLPAAKVKNRGYECITPYA